MTSIELFVVLLCMMSQAFFAGIETGVISIHRMRLRHFVKQGTPGAQTLELFLKDSDRLLGTTLVGTNISTVIASVVAASLGARLSPAYGQVLSTVYLTCLYRFRGDTAAAQRYGDRSLAVVAEVDMPIYEGVAHANLAWLRWREGLTDGAWTEAKRALALWGEFAYPFRWLANWVLLAVHEKRGELAEAVEQAQAILHPSQRRQPGELPEVLERAVRAWQAGKPDPARAALQQAIELAQAEGYL